MISTNYLKYIKSFIFVFLIELFTNTTFAVSDLPFNSLSYPVLATLDDNSSGSGFYLSDKGNFYFVTARHVIFNNELTLKSKTITLSSCCSPDISKKIVFKINLEELYKSNLIKFHEIHDVTIIYLGKISNNTVTYGNYIKRISSETCSTTSSDTLWIKKFHDIPIGNEIYIFGFPNSLGLVKNQQLDYAAPLLRKGIVAGKNVHNNTIIIDCPVYQGNSGGPVLVIEKMNTSTTTFLPIGIVTQFVPFVEEWVNNRYENVKNITISNSGYSIVEPIDIVLELLFK